VLFRPIKGTCYLNRLTRVACWLADYPEWLQFCWDFVKVNGMWEDLIRIQFRTTKYFSFYTRERSIHMLGLHRHFLWVRLRILVMDEMSLEV